jgi:gliding motility-associated-like protein
LKITFNISSIFIFVLATCFQLNGVSTSAQNEGNIWYFGYNAGMDFNSGDPIPLTNSAMYTWEGCASISDQDGNLLFYTNGKKVWNANHEQMTNGFGLYGHDSSTMAAVIVKKPGPNLIYMIFTPDAFGYANGLTYTEVDMGLEGGLGAVNENKNVSVVGPVAEKVIAIQHENQMDYWIITHLSTSNEFYCYLLSEEGLSNSPIISAIDPNTGPGFEAIGYLRANATGNKIAMAGPGLWLYNFNKASGEITNPQELDIGEFGQAYGVEFSYGGKVLYASIEGVDDIYQYNLDLATVEEINDSRHIVVSGENYGGALQLGPDKRIYHAIWNAEYLGVIEYPELLGSACSYIQNGFYMEGKVTGIGLPNFKNSIFNVAAYSYSNTCFGDLSKFIANTDPVDSVYWDFGDPISGSANNSTLIAPTHYYQDPGFYEVSLVSYVDSLVDSVAYWIYIKEPPFVDLGNDTTICEGQIIPLDAALINARYLWQDQSTEPVFYAEQPGYYFVEVTQNYCSKSFDKELSPCDPIIRMPNVFTPNGDGKNDLFKPIQITDVKEANLSIYDRWGKVMLDKGKLGVGWDGLNNGAECSDGVYYYIVNYQGIDFLWYNLNGYVTLLR